MGQRGQQKIECGGGQTDADKDAQVAQRQANQPQILDTGTIADTDDRPHQRRDQHGADDDGGGVDVEADRGDQDGEKKHPQIGAADRNAATDRLVDHLGVILVMAEMEQATQGIAVFFHVLSAWPGWQQPAASGHGGLARVG